MINRIGRRGQVTLPSQLRKRLHLKEDDRIAFTCRGDDLVLHVVKKTLLELRGSVPVTGPQNFDAIRRQVVQYSAEKRTQHVY